jgi:flagellar basal body-associated protein FliL
MPIGKIAVAVVILAIAITAVTFGAFHSSKVEANSPVNVESTGTEARHFSLNLTEDVNIKSNP